MMRALLLLSLLASASALRAQLPGPETVDVSAYRTRITFVDPVPQLATASTHTPLDTTPRRIQVRYDVPPEVKRMQDAHIARLVKVIEVDGFRIQVFAGGREEAYRLEAELKTTYPDIRVQTVYDRPNWKTRMGDFLSRLEAERFLKQLRTQYPAAFIVPDQVRLKK